MCFLQGYVAIRSDPSLIGNELNSYHNLRKSSPMLNNTSNNNSTPNLQSVMKGDPATNFALMASPAASAGYHSTRDFETLSEEISVMQGLPHLGKTSLVRGGGSSSAISGIGAPSISTTNFSAPLPLYSRHSFTPPEKGRPATGSNEHGGGNSTVPFGELKYVAVAINPDADINSLLSSPESLNESQTGSKHTPSATIIRPSIASSDETGEKYVGNNPLINPSSPYCVVGTDSRFIKQPLPSSQGYVTSGSLFQQPNNNTKLCNDPDISSGMMNSISNVTTKPSNNGYVPHTPTPTIVKSSTPNSPISSNLNAIEPSNRNGYVTVTADVARLKQNTGTSNPTNTDRKFVNNGYVTAQHPKWAESRERPTHLDMADDIRDVASAPSENTRSRNTHQNERPSTSDGVRSYQADPPLSNHSSGYVSQEALTEPVVMSPKRLFARNHEPKSVMSNSFDMSFV